MLSITNSLLLLSALFSFGSMIFILRDNWRNATNFFLGMFLLFLSLWATVLIFFAQETNPENALSFGNLAYIFALAIGACLYLFSLVFPENKVPSIARILVILTPLLIFVCSLLIKQNFLITSITFEFEKRIVTLEMFGWATFTVFFVSLYVLGVHRLWQKAKQAKVFLRKQLLIIIISLCITGVGGMFYNLILASPFFNNFDYLWSGPIFSTAVAVAIMYSVFRFHLFNAKVFLAEVFISLLWVFTLLRTLVSVPPSQDTYLNGLLFLLAFLIGILLLKSVKKEVEARELVEKQAHELEIANEKLKGLDKLKSEFISLASHQLRSPLTVIKGYASTLTDGVVGELTPKQAEIVKHIYTSATGLANVVEDFLNVTKIEQGGMEYAFAPVDIRAIVTDLVSDMRIPTEDKHLKFKTSIDMNESFFANADSTKIKQVFLNLIDNSIKYTKEGFVKVALKRIGNQIEFSVSDSGVGMDSKTKSKLFKKFGRADKSLLNTGGSGLGLYLAQEIAEAHGGEILAESDGLGKGSTFSVVLPIIKK